MAEAASVFHSGFNGTTSVLVNAVVTEFSVIRWSVIPTADIVKFMNSRSGPYPIREATFRDITGSIEIDYDFANPLYSSLGFNFQPGKVMANLQCYLNQTSRYLGLGVGTGSLDGPYWFIGSAIIASMPQTLTNDGKNTTSIAWATASASILYPS